jgi:uncharacterized membrane protein
VDRADAVGRSRRSRLGTALFWFVGGALHWVVRREYESYVPPPFTRWRREIVVARGVAEIAGGLAVLPDRTRRWARWWLLATLAAVYPANVRMAVRSKDFPRIPAPALWARLPFQFLFGWLTWRGTR